VRCPSCGGSIKVGTRACPFCSSTVATCRCARCLAWNLAGAAHCQACGKRMIKGGASKGTAAGCACPRCSATLQAREYADLSVDECDNCGGLFLDPAMLDKLVAARDTPTGLRLALPKRAVSREVGVRYIRCPVCSKMMNRQAFARISGVIIDICKADGMWFDAGELAEVLRFVEAGGLERARERDMENLAERERRSRTEAIIAQASMSMDVDGNSYGSSWNQTGNVFSDLVRFIGNAWRSR
jgi:Zn-finger nucleic acid-binding protein